MQAPHQAKSDADAAQTTSAKPAAQERSLLDQRPAAVAQGKMAGVLNNSPQVLQQRALSDAIDNSARMVAQCHDMHALLGGALPARDEKPNEKPNNAGLPSQLKSGIESLSGMRMDHVKVHYNSAKPAQLQAHAYAQGSEIHLGAGQEKHLPHEAWHVVQQAQGRVRPTLQMKAIAVNDDPSLEKEADLMGEKAAQFKGELDARPLSTGSRPGAAVAQGKFTRAGLPQTYDQILAWFDGLPLPEIALGDDNRTILKLLSDTSTAVACETYPSRQQFVDYLNTEEENYRPAVETHYTDDGTAFRQPLPGKLASDGVSLEAWKLGASTPHAAAGVVEGSTTLVHVTHNTADMDGKKMDTNRGESGEFQAGLYLVSGHSVQPAEKIRDQWSAGSKQYTKVIHFQLDNATIKEMAGSTDPEHALIIFMLQQPSGYPNGDAGAALVLINQINAKGKVLLFPDDKGQEVVIDGKGTRKSWNAFVEGERSDGDHAIVIGPQKPPTLDGVRQVALRGAYASVLANSAPRRLQTMAPPTTGPVVASSSGTPVRVTASGSKGASKGASKGGAKGGGGGGGRKK
jgi:hypothetical protein